MRNSRNILLIALVALISNVFAQGYKISVQVKNTPKDSLCQLAYYYGDRKLLKDSARVQDDKGNFVFEGDSKLEKGIYLIVVPGGKYFEFIANDATEFSMKTTDQDYIKGMEIKGSPENVLFYDYLKYVGEIGPKMATASDEEKVTLNKQIEDYKEKFILEHPNTFVSVLFKSMQDVTIPDRETWPDSTYGYRYFKKHYFDNISFKDPRMLRTPVFEGKVDYYLDKLVVQHWDSLNAECDYLMAQIGTEGNYEMFKYMLIHLTRKFGDMKIMCMDEVPWHLYKNYFLEDKRVDWIDSTNMVKIKEEVIKKTYNRCGDRPPNLIFRDTTGAFHSLHDLKSEYTVVYFWSATCGHCKKATPILWDYYQTVKDKGVEVYTVCIDKDIKEFKKFINKYNFSWLNTYDTENTNNFRVSYNVFSTPTIYVLDKDKKVIGKKIDVKTVKRILNDKLGLPQEEEDSEEEDHSGHNH